MGIAPVVSDQRL